MKLGYKLICVLVSVLFIIGQSKAQKQPEKETEETKQPAKDYKDSHHGVEGHTDWVQVKIADNLLEQHSYYNAIDKYKEIYEHDKQNPYVVYKLALSYFLARDYAHAEEYFKRSAFFEDKKKPDNPMSFFYYAETLMMNRKYEEAKLMYVQFYKLKTKDLEQKRYAKIAKSQFKACSFAQEMIKGDTSFTTVAFLEGDVNHAYTDFSPHPIGEDTLMFASLRVDSVISVDYGDETFYPVKLYTSVREGESWGTPKALNAKVNHKFEHTANAVITSDGKRMYYTRCVPDRTNKVVCSIYYADKEGKSWGKAHKLPMTSHGNIFSGTYTSTQPTIGESTKKRRRKVITQRVLYFSSNRPGGLGGKDIWYILIDEKGNHGDPINCGRRINTIRDEISPYYDSKTKTLYFSSNYHHGLGGYDIFESKGHTKRFSKPVNKGIPVNCSYDDTYFTPSNEKDGLMYGYLVSNRPGGIALTSETCCDDIYRFEDFEPPMCHLTGFLKLKSSQNESSNATVPDSAATASIDSTITASIDTTITSTNITGDDETKWTPLENVSVGLVKQRHVDEAETEGKSNYKFYEKWITWVDTTDASGQFDADVVIGKHYSIVFVGDTTFDPYVENLDEYMAKCPSSETIVIGVEPKSKKETTDPADSTGGPKDGEVEFREALNLDVETEDIKKDTKFILEDLFFDFDKDVVKKESEPSIQLLFMFLESHPKIKIEIAGHTDSKGNDAYNEDLSQRRSNTVRQLMIDQGIPAERMVAKGHGEKEPIAPNTKPDGSDNPKGRALNRRTEIVILSTDYKSKGSSKKKKKGNKK